MEEVYPEGRTGFSYLDRRAELWEGGIEKGFLRAPGVGF